MRYGCCVNMVTQTPDVSGIDVIPELKALGYDYAELSLSHLCAMTHADFNRLVSKINDIGFPVEACNNFFPENIRLTGLFTNKEAIVEHLETALQRAYKLGVKVIVFGSGPARTVSKGFSLDRALFQLANLLELFSQHASKHDIDIAIEPLRKQECNIINTYREALQLAQKVNTKSVKCLLDYFHLSEEKEDISIICNDNAKLAHIHFAEPNGRVFPYSEKKKEYKNFFSNVKKTGYDGRISIEAYSQNFASDAKASLRILKEIESELNHQL